MPGEREMGENSENKWLKKRKPAVLKNQLKQVEREGIKEK